MAEVIRKGFKDKAGNNVKLIGVPDDGKADKVPRATSGNLAGLDSNGNLTDSGKKPSDFAAAVHNHIFGGSDDAVTIVEGTNGDYVIDTTTSGEFLSRLASGAGSGIFTPIRVKLGNDYHIGYYLNRALSKSIHVDGLVFEWDSTNGWSAAKPCLFRNQVPHWEKIGATTGLYDKDYSIFTVSQSVASMLYVGMPIRLYGKESNSNFSYRCRVVKILHTSGLYTIQVSVPLDADVTSQGLFDIYALDNLDVVLVYDAEPTQYSTHLMTSGAIYIALSGKMANKTIDSTPADNEDHLISSKAVYEALAALEDRVEALEALHEEETEPSAES